MRKGASVRVFAAGPGGSVRWGGRSRHTAVCRAPRDRGKRVLDLAAAAALLLLVAPLLLLAAVAIRLDTPGPVLFRQTRIGWRGRRFRIVKLRTLYWRAGGGQVLPGDPRVTRVGRWLRRTSLDELPQLVNVLRGEMSLVGPRPHALREDLRFARLVPAYAGRRQVRPGLTGPAQVSGCRGAIRHPDELYRRTRHDLAYVAGRSGWGDLAILLRTLPAVIGRAGVGRPRD